MTEVHLHGVHEAALEASRQREDVMPVALVSPSGGERSIHAFRDGGSTWRIRFSPDEVGTWRWSAPSGAKGEFRCVPYSGENPLYRRGPLRRSEDSRHLVHEDGTPFFWLGDTAWNGLLRSRESDWRRYLATRAEQGFTAVQFVMTPWRAWMPAPDRPIAWEGTEDVRIDPAFFRRLDAKVAEVNAQGLIAAPVLLWALLPTDPGRALAEDDAVRVARYLVARYGAFQAVWFLGGDGRFHEDPERWKRIGRAAFPEERGAGGRRLVTLHPCGQQWVGEIFRGEPWFDFIGYQSGHGDSDDDLRWLTQGPPATDWRNEPALPVINLEPNYETHPAYQSCRRFTAREVRRAAWWSVLVSPTAGVTFGHNAIWAWLDEPGVPEGHEGIGVVPSWTDALDTPGIRSMSVLKTFFDVLPWWTLRPAPALIAEQPGLDAPDRFIAAAASPDGSLAVVYAPVGGRLVLNARALRTPASARWFNPETEEWTDAGRLAGKRIAFDLPGDADRVLVVGHLRSVKEPA
jgi:hypothetical protein